MNPLIKKEIRILLPGFLIGTALAFANFFLIDSVGDSTNVLVGVFSFVGCAAMAIFVALNSFGAEFNSGTFSTLLAQPVSRQQIWRTKTWLLATAFFLGGSLWCVAFTARFQSFIHSDSVGDFWQTLLIAWVFLAVVYSGALWTVLLLRQMAAAFWFTLLTPAAIAMVISGLWPEKFYSCCEPAVVVALLAYSVAGVWYAHRLFMRAQDVAWTGGNIVWPEWRAASNASTGSTAKNRRWRPSRALFWKEVSLQQSQFIMAAVLLVLHLGVLVARKFGHFPTNSDTQFILESFWFLWLVMPMLVGATAVAEERKLGTLASQLCLPVKHRAQFWVKFRLVLFLSMLFGVGLPLLLEGGRILPHVHFLASGFYMDPNSFARMGTGQWVIWDCLGYVNALMPCLLFMGMAAAIGVISFYVSTLTRNTLQALGPSVLGIIIFSFQILVASDPGFNFFYLRWHGPLVYVIGLPAFFITLVALACSNFQRLDPGWPVWRRNILIAVATLLAVTVATPAIYYRSWEKLSPFEPAHGPAQLSASSPPALIQHWNFVSVHLPNGRIWSDLYNLNFDRMHPLGLFLGNIRLVTLGGGHFYEGSNWVDLVPGLWFQEAGVKADGTLWVSEKPAHREQLINEVWTWSKPGGLVQYGSDTNWSSIAWLNQTAMVLVKTDGTLWRWGTNNWNLKTPWPGLQSFTPQRLGSDSDWADIFLADIQTCLRKKDGSSWTTWVDQGNPETIRELEPGLSIQRAPYIPDGKWHSTTTMWKNLDYRLGVADGGTLHILADQRLNPQTRYYEWTATDLQFRQGANWVAVAGRGDKIVTLKDDGTLWFWPFRFEVWRGTDRERDEREMIDTVPVRLGVHNDWIAIATADGGIISLAADGSLWYWPLETAGYYASEMNDSPFWDNNSNQYFEPLLDISRKPQLLENIFNNAN